MLSTLRSYAPRVPELEPLPPSKNMAHDVARTLRHWIVTLQIPPGTMLSEQDIGRKLGVSRQPVREAFIKLAEGKLLVIRPQRGTQVVRISRAAVDDALFIRSSVECAVVREAALRFDQASEALLGENLERQKAVLLDNAGFEALLSLDEEFHQIIAQAAGRSAAWSVIENVKPHLDRVRWLSMDLQPLSRIVLQHEAVFGALRAGDQDRAAEAMRVHVTDLVALLDPIAAHHPHLFENEPPDLDRPGIPIVILR